LKDPAHALELIEDVAGLLFIGIGNDDEVRAGDAEPLLGREAMSRRHAEENADKQRSQAHRSVAILATIGEGDCDGRVQTGVVEDDLPAVGAEMPDEREDAVVFFRFAMGGAVEVEVAGDDGVLGWPAGVGKEADLDVGEGEMAHLLGRGVALAIALEDGVVALADGGTDEGCVGEFS
jgi:hypothetical protein